MNYNNHQRNNTDYNDILSSLHHYMLTPKLLSQVSNITSDGLVKTYPEKSVKEGTSSTTLSKSKKEEIFFRKKMICCFGVILL